jgi:hypothetical protein
MKTTTTVITILTTFVIFYGAAVLFSVVGNYTGPWEGRILDINTGEPIEGAVVLAVWRTKTAAIIDYTHSVHGATEAVTDARGYFHIPQYNPVNYLPGISQTNGPYIQIYKPGYLFLDRINPMKLKRDVTNKDSTDGLNKSQELNLTYRVSANIIELPKLPDLSLDEKNKYLLVTRPNDVPAEKMVNFTKALNEARASLGYSPLDIK